MHNYEPDPQSGAGNCHCGRAEASRVHPHAYVQASVPTWRSDTCVCTAPASDPVHTDAGTPRPQPKHAGLDAVQHAVELSRGGPAPARIEGWA